MAGVLRITIWKVSRHSSQLYSPYSPELENNADRSLGYPVIPARVLRVAHYAYEFVTHPTGIVPIVLTRSLEWKPWKI
jgi:hypothetical protein